MRIHTEDGKGNVVSDVIVPDSQRDINADAIRTKAQQALAANVAARNQIATFAAQAKPGTAATQASAAYDAVKQLAAITDAALRELNALIRLTLGQLDDASDT